VYAVGRLAAGLTRYAAGHGLSVLSRLVEQVLGARLGGRHAGLDSLQVLGWTADPHIQTWTISSRQNVSTA
jgi:hypothetical protein